MPTLVSVVGGPFGCRSPRGRVGRVETRHRLAVDGPGYNVSMRADHAGAGEEGEDGACGRLLSGQLKRLTLENKVGHLRSTFWRSTDPNRSAMKDLIKRLQKRQTSSKKKATSRNQSESS